MARTPQLSLTARKALARYGHESCRLAFYYANRDGFGAAGILHGCNTPFNFRTVSQVDAAINAYAELLSRFPTPTPSL